MFLTSKTLIKWKLIINLIDFNQLMSSLNQKFKFYDKLITNRTHLNQFIDLISSFTFWCFFLSFTVLHWRRKNTIFPLFFFCFLKQFPCCWRSLWFTWATFATPSVTSSYILTRLDIQPKVTIAQENKSNKSNNSKKEEEEENEWRSRELKKKKRIEPVCLSIFN